MFCHFPPAFYIRPYQAFMASPSTYLETWPGAAWPADNVAVLYSLVVHDLLYGTTYYQAADRWVAAMKATLDPDTELMTSRINYQTGASLDVPRGCALSFTFILLADFAPEFAATQYAAYRRHYLETTLGFAGLREYPPRQQRRADIDSGPIIRGVGAAATGFGIGASRAMGDEVVFESIVRLAEIIGFPLVWQGLKSYLWGQLLLGDEIRMWGKTITPWRLGSSAEREARQARRDPQG